MGNKSKTTTVSSEQTKKSEKKTTKKEEVVASKQETDTTQFEEQLSSVQEIYSNAKKQMQNLLSNIKKLQVVHNSEMKKVRTKKSKRNGNHNPTGFARLRNVPSKIAEFIGVAPETELSGPEITKKVWAVLKERGLTYKGDESKGIKGDQRVLRVDDEISNLFFIPKSVNKSTKSDDPEGFNFRNLQFYIKQGLEGKKLERVQKEKKSEGTTLNK